MSSAAYDDAMNRIRELTAERDLLEERLRDAEFSSSTNYHIAEERRIRIAALQLQIETAAALRGEMDSECANGRHVQSGELFRGGDGIVRGICEHCRRALEPV